METAARRASGRSIDAACEARADDPQSRHGAARPHFGGPGDPGQPAAYVGRQSARAGYHDGPPGHHAPSTPDPGAILEVERKISDRRCFASRSELLAALHAGFDSAELDRVLDHLERSAKIATGDGSIRWASSDASPRNDSGADKSGGDVRAAGNKAEEPVHILSMEERLSADLDNDLPYSKDLERVIADCKAGRATGKTYTLEEYLEAFDQEFGGGPWSVRLATRNIAAAPRAPSGCPA